MGVSWGTEASGANRQGHSPPFPQCLTCGSGRVMVGHCRCTRGPASGPPTGGCAEATPSPHSARCPGCDHMGNRRTEGLHPSEEGAGGRSGCLCPLQWGSLHTASHGGADWKHEVGALAWWARPPCGSQTARRTKGLRGPFPRTQCRWPGLHPHDLSASQRPPLFTPSSWRFRDSPYDRWGTCSDHSLGVCACVYFVVRVQVRPGATRRMKFEPAVLRGQHPLVCFRVFCSPWSPGVTIPGCMWPQGSAGQQPGLRGWGGRARYASPGLCFSLVLSAGRPWEGLSPGSGRKLAFPGEAVLALHCLQLPALKVGAGCGQHPLQAF